MNIRQQTQLRSALVCHAEQRLAMTRLTRPEKFVIGVCLVAVLVLGVMG